MNLNSSLINMEKQPRKINRKKTIDKLRIKECFIPKSVFNKIRSVLSEFLTKLDIILELNNIKRSKKKLSNHPIYKKELAI